LVQEFKRSVEVYELEFNSLHEFQLKVSSRYKRLKRSQLKPRIGALATEAERFEGRAAPEV
jgi:hypothetical protein